jgi:hypothetical protein
LSGLAAIHDRLFGTTAHSNPTIVSGIRTFIGDILRSRKFLTSMVMGIFRLSWHGPRGEDRQQTRATAYIDAPQLDFTAIQTKGTNPLEHHRLTVDWIQRCQACPQRVLMVGYDEGRPEEDHRAWWNTRNGKDGAFQNESSVSGGRPTLVPPGPGDGAARLVRSARSAGNDHNQSHEDISHTLVGTGRRSLRHHVGGCR